MATKVFALTTTPGPTGPAGYSPQWIVAAGAPSAGTGNNDDMYLNSTTSDVYGPKTAGAWGSIVANIKGLTGSSSVWHSGAGVPASGLGNNGDMYLNTSTGDVYGPKTAGAWGGIVENIVGPAGGVADPGANGILFRSALNTTRVATSTDLNGTDYAAGGGTAQAQTVTLSPAITSLVAGQVVRWLPVAANTGAAPTLAVNGLVAKSITKYGTTALVANDLTTTAIAVAIYDGTQFQLLNPQTASSGITTQNVVIASRALGTAYQNTGSRAMFVSVTATIPAIDYLQVNTDSAASPTTVVSIFQNGSGAPTVEACITFFVLPGHFYKVLGTGCTLQYWVEWQ